MAAVDVHGMNMHALDVHGMNIRVLSTAGRVYNMAPGVLSTS
jgi:hypothetical protein